MWVIVLINHLLSPPDHPSTPPKTQVPFIAEWLSKIERRLLGAADLGFRVQGLGFRDSGFRSQPE